jgi:type II secretion system protein D
MAASPAAATHAHAIVGANAKGVAAKLKQIYADRTDVQINDTVTGQVVVHGSPAVQQEIARWLAAEGLVAPPPAESPPAPLQTVAYSEPQRAVTRTWPLRNLSARDFEAKLAKTWGTNLQSSQDQVGDVATFRFPPTAAGTTSIVIDRRANTATVTAPKSSAGSWERLISILDSRPKSSDERTSIVPLVKADPNTIRKAVSLLTQVFTAADTRRKQHVGQFVSMLFQPEAGAAQPAGGAQPAAPTPAPAGETTAQAVPAGAASAASMEAIARINNVQIEILDDVIVVRGRKEDVDRVLQIIEQIEQQSLQFKPEIEIFYLKHIDSTALSAMIDQVYTAAFSRQGQVTYVALQRPNAILLIGRKENIPSLIELISKLDQPGPTDGEFKIFRLQNMSSIDAERTIRTFFVTRPPTVTDFRPGLGTRALVIADYRSNSLLVQAAPRDMLEITRLISELDVSNSTVGYEVKVFKLRNSIAETLAPVLEEAITAAAASTTATAAVGAAGQATPARATPPAVSLQFERLGSDGVSQLIRSGIMANVRINADTRTNSLIVTGPASAMGLMAALIEQLDTLPASVARIKVFTIRNGDATALAEMLTNLFGQAQQANQQAPGQVSPTGQGESAIVPLRFSVDQRTNSIIATGNEGDLNVIFHILTRLDEGDIRQRQTAVYRLRNAPAQDVSNALTSLLQQQLLLIQSAPELVTPVETLDRQVIVVPEIVTNSLIVSATSRYFQEISRIIETLDRRPPMVVIQVVLAEVTLDDTEQFGVEWGLQDALMFDRSSSAAITSNRFNFNGTNPSLPNDSGAVSLATAPRVATQALSNFVLGRSDSTLGFGGLVLSASSESVNVLLRALESSSRGQIISRPQVQTLDNLPAFVQVGALVPRITGAATTGLSVVPILADINVGLIMQVTPRTSPDGTIVMQVYAEKSSVGPEATAIPISTDANGNVIKSPQIPRTLAQTTISARSGQTVILGGLITKDLETNTRRIPYLADIPVLGRLFRFDTMRNTRTELLIIMTPYLVTSEEQIDWINARESERMSWCVADIVNIHGPVPMSGNPAFNSDPTPLIYPDLQPGAMPGVAPGTTPPGTPAASPYGPAHPGGYPSGPMPYQPGPPRLPSGGSLLPGSSGPSAPGAPTISPPGPTVPGGYPPGPMPYLEGPPRAPSSSNVPPPPPPGPGLGSSRRTNDGIIVPQPPSLMQPGNPNAHGVLSPPTIQPAAPPVGTGVTPVANTGQWPPLGPPPQMIPLPPSGGVAPAEYQQAVMR